MAKKISAEEAQKKADEAAEAAAKAARAEVARFLHEQADLAYRPVAIEFEIPDGPMAPGEVDALIEGLRAIAASADGRARFYRRLGELGGRVGRAAATGGL